jgi:hypothetical protein
LADTESNPFALLFLKLDQGPDLLPEIINGAIEFPVDAPGQTRYDRKIEFGFHSRQTVTNPRLSGKSLHPNIIYLYFLMSL